MWETIIAKANTVIPRAVDEALRITGTRLLGKLFEIPEVWADGEMPTLKNDTESGSILSRVLTEAAIKGGLFGPDVISALYSVSTDDLQRKSRNKAVVFKKAVELIADKSIHSDEYASVPDDDWLNAFQRISEDATSEKLRDRLSRILSGEIIRSGSYAISTLRAISELDKYTEECLSEITSESFDKIHIYKSEKYSAYPWWDRINTLRDAGFISASDGAIHNPSVHLGAPDGIGYWSIGAEPAVMIKFRKRGRSEIPVFKMTRLGIEISTLLSAPDFERNLRFMVEDNPYKDGWIEVNLLVGGQIAESIYSGNSE